MNNFRQLLETLMHQCDDGESTVLATIVEVSGSSYRRPGAMMLLTQENQRCGMISGGCLEKNLALRAWDLTENGSRVVAYDTRGRLQQPAGEFGAGCEGVVYVLLERLTPENWLLDLLNSIVLDRQPRRTATVFRLTASAADTAGVHVGRRFFENRSGKDDDGFASGQLPSDAAVQTIRFHLNRNDWETETFSLRLQIEQDESIDILFETKAPIPRLVVFGAGDDALPLVAIAQAAGWDTLVWDKRSTLLSPTRFPSPRSSHLPSAGKTVCSPARDAIVDRMRLTAADAVVLMTHDLNDDATLLSQLVEQPVSYIGLLGPKRRTAKVVEELYRRGALPDNETLAKVRTPIGLDIGADGPEEIAIAILAEIISHRNGRAGGPLHARQSSNNQAMPIDYASWNYGVRESEAVRS